MPGNVLEMPPRGHYLADEVGRLAGVSGDRVGQWARRGYIRSSQSTDRPRVYSYQDVAEAMVVHDLLARGAPLDKIKHTIEHLRDTHGYDWPLQNVPLAADQGRVVVFEDDAGYDVSKREWQQVVDSRNLLRIRSQLERGGWVVRQLPDLAHIEVTPERLSGTPTIKGRRIPAADVARLANEPGGESTLREDYELQDAEIQDAIRWWSATSQPVELAAA